MATWKKVLTSGSVFPADITGSDGSADQVLTTNGSGAFSWTDLNEGDLTSIVAGDGLTGSSLTGPIPTLAANVDDTTVEISSDAIQAKTAAIADGGTGLATADQIHTFVTDFGYGTMTNFGFAGNTTATINAAGTIISDGETFTIEGDTGLTTHRTANKLTISPDSGYKLMNTSSQSFSGTKTFSEIIVSGNLTVSGTQTLLNTETLQVEDKMIKLANVTSPDASTATGAGIQIEASGTEAQWPELRWTSAQGAGNTDGSGTANGLTGWSVSNFHTSNEVDLPIAVMEFSTNSTAPTGNAGGVGSFHFDSGDDKLYVRTA
tara:strand:+ start:173 stop:1132 length:960 start_codon:yes stop_codon:yes gene_type:complete